MIKIVWNRRYYIVIIMLLLLVALFTAKPLLSAVSSHLTKNQKVPANTLVVEGWVSDYALKMAYLEFKQNNYDYIITTGLNFQGHFKVYTNSFVIFHPHESIVKDTIPRTHDFEIHVASTIDEEDSCHFSFWINSSKVFNGYTRDNGGSFKYLWDGRLSVLDSVMIQYDNDMYGPKGDRNLVIEKFCINQQNLITENADMFLDRGRPFGKARKNITAISYAEISANFFTDLGVDEKFVIPVSNNRTNINRTYGNALALKEWLIENKLDVQGINIVSMDNHSKRTWLTYRKLLDSENVGIISVSDQRKKKSPWDKYFRLFKETVAMAYYQVFILPWI